ncbi:hypothetical protein K2X30_05255 [bacterium]|nr:hypothetical protein [bacterium]
MKASRILLGVSVLVLSGCGVQKATAEKKPLVAENLKVISVKNLNLTDNTIFLWKAKTQPEDVAAVLATSRRLEEMKRKNAAIEGKKAALRAKFAEKSLDIDGIQMDLDSAKGALDLNEKNLVRDQGFLKTEMDKPETERDVKKVEKLKKQIANAEKKITDSKAAIATVEQSIADAGLQDAWTEWTNSGNEKSKTMEELPQLAKGLAARVDVYERAPQAIQFKTLPNGSYEMEILQWALKNGDEPQDFSTSNKTIVNVKYTELGGILEFDVLAPQTSPQEILRFKLFVRLISNTQGESVPVALQGEVIKILGKTPAALGSASFAGESL